MEVNAAFLEHVDFQVGRIIEHLEEMGELDNTLVIYLMADNGATAEGTPTGTVSELLMQNGFPPLTMEQQLELLERYGGIDEWGGPNLANHFSVAWAWATSRRPQTDKGVPVGLVNVHTFSMDQTNGIALWWYCLSYSYKISKDDQCTW